MEGLEIPFCFDPPEDGLYPCSRQLANLCCCRWHYSKCLPLNHVALYAAFENAEVVGSIAYCRGVNPQIGTEYGLNKLECCELQRVAFTNHAKPISEYLAESLRLLKVDCPKLRLVVSYADSAQGHEGKIYQASNWIYVGASYAQSVIIKGKPVHPRSVKKMYGSGSLEWLKANVDPEAVRLDTPAKHKYLMPLDKQIRRRVEKLRLAYPSCESGIESDPPPVQGGRLGATPTDSLRTTETSRDCGSSRPDASDSPPASARKCG